MYHGRWIFKKNAKNIFSLFKLRRLSKIICRKNGGKKLFYFLRLRESHEISYGALTALIKILR